MKVVEVSTRLLEKAFIKVHHILYKGDKNWVCPLDADIEAVFDEHQNLYYQDGDAKRWLLYDDKKISSVVWLGFITKSILSNQEKRSGEWVFLNV